ncbi:hypothetical protein [Rhizobium sp. BK418]|uniref:hypothetical protein n=1 Tax=Rhizobium sp. BK418 TaxID=2512120 RepID=UPI00104A065F|nr:hypothetical protein [Rhizobium sp. BK418]TCR95962.1 hypothetical protein EV281_11210 [Rhizobium sp. BK418]
MGMMIKTLPIANQTQTANTWADQNRQGRELADALTVRMMRDENPLLLARVLKSLYSETEPTGVKTGFVQRVAEHLMKSSVAPIDPTTEAGDILDCYLAR